MRCAGRPAIVPPRRAPRRQGPGGPRRLPPHPEDQPGEHGDREEHREALERLLRRARKLSRRQLEGAGGGEAETAGGDGARPYGAEVLAVAGAAQVAEDDGEHEGDLEALAEDDQEGEEQALTSPANTARSP